MTKRPSIAPPATKSPAQKSARQVLRLSRTMRRKQLVARLDVVAEVFAALATSTAIGLIDDNARIRLAQRLAQMTPAILDLAAGAGLTVNIG